MSTPGFGEGKKDRPSRGPQGGRGYNPGRSVDRLLYIGSDWGLQLHDLLEEIAQIEGIKRVRYTSPHPQDIDECLVRIMSKYPNICNHIHLPLQSGSDRILNRMNRTYTKQEFLDLVKMIRNIIPNCALSTDIIVGFPGETAAEFEETLEVVQKS